MLITQTKVNMQAVGRFVLKLLQVVALCICCLTEAKQPHRKVLILGAGLSGIVAGKTLQDNGVDDFLVLEGQDYIGGRIKQVLSSFLSIRLLFKSFISLKAMYL